MLSYTVMMGRLTKDPEVRYIQGQNPMAIANFSLAVDRKVKKEGETSADFWNCTAFGKTGEFSMVMSLVDEQSFKEKYRTYTMNLLYEAFAAENMTKEQADKAMVDAYGLNVADYVDAALKVFDVNEMFEAFNVQEVYYVEDNNLFTALTWNATFESAAFTVTDDSLEIEGISMDEDGQALVWKKS